MKVPDGDDYVEFMLYAVKPAPNARSTQHYICLETTPDGTRVELMEPNTVDGQPVPSSTAPPPRPGSPPSTPSPRPR